MPKRIEKQVTAGLYDETINSKAMARLQELSVDDSTIRRIGELLGEYLFDREALDTRPTLSQSRVHVKETHELISSLIEKLELMPEEVKAFISYLILRSSGEGRSIENDILFDLRVYRVACVQYVNKMRNRIQKNDTNSKYYEHRLLSGVAEVLESAMPKKEKKKNIAGASLTILLDAGIDNNKLPKNPRKADEAIRAFRKNYLN